MIVHSFWTVVSLKIQEYKLNSCYYYTPQVNCSFLDCKTVEALLSHGPDTAHFSTAGVR